MKYVMIEGNRQKSEAKFWRRLIDFVLDPLEMEIGKDRDLFEHIDGKRSCGNPYMAKPAKENNPYKV